MNATPKDYEMTFATDAGKRVLADLEDLCKADHKRDIFEIGRPDLTAFNCGLNAVWKYIGRRLDENVSEPKQEFAIKET